MVFTLFEQVGVSWPSLGADCAAYIDDCIGCRLFKAKPAKNWIWNAMSLPRLPFRVIVVDHVGPFKRTRRGNRFILRVVCVLTMAGFLIPTPDTKRATTIHCLKVNVFASHGWPLAIKADGPFTTLREILAPSGVHVIIGNPESPTSQWQAERPNREQTRQLYAAVHQHGNDWDEITPALQLSWRCSPMERLNGRTPLEALTGAIGRMPISTALAPPSGRPSLRDPECYSAADTAEHLVVAMKGIRDDIVEAGEAINEKNCLERAAAHGTTTSPLSVGDIVTPFEKLEKGKMGVDRDSIRVYIVDNIISNRAIIIREVLTKGVTVSFGGTKTVNPSNYIKLGTKNVITSYAKPKRIVIKKRRYKVVAINNYTLKSILKDERSGNYTEKFLY